MTGPVFYINLDTKTDRRERMEARFKRLGIDAIRISASTPTSLIYVPDSIPYTGGEKGCADSHYRVWVHMVVNQIPSATIFEDDVVFHPEFLKFAQEIESLKVQNADWDAFFFSHLDPVSPNDTWTRMYRNHSTAGYHLSLKAATWLVNTFKGRQGPSDLMTWNLQLGNNCYGRFPWCAIQEYLDTDIQSKSHMEADKAKRDQVLLEASVDPSIYA